MIPPSLRRALRWARHFPARLLHARRRARARQALGAAEPVGKMLVLCHGNICRSPFAEAVLRRRLSEARLTGSTVASAGFIGPGRPSPDLAQAVARSRGYDLAAHRSRVVGRDELVEGPIVLVMNRQQRQEAIRRGAPASRVFWLADFDDKPIETRAIPDPVDRAREVFESVYERIERCADAVVEVLAARSGPRRTGTSITTGPFR